MSAKNGTIRYQRVNFKIYLPRAGKKEFGVSEWNEYIYTHINSVLIIARSCVYVNKYTFCSLALSPAQSVVCSFVIENNRRQTPITNHLSIWIVLFLRVHFLYTHIINAFLIVRLLMPRLICRQERVTLLKL